ncbi:DUF2913 family protein [Yersinia enterocolitica]|uniref:DUF2913 family protein n=1 Tax=Yersinia enterocolitica TaxID=630 RepID=UPI001C6084D4|nr:DUF2913 family protein [Yersinia enterocolitica]MBW5840124.1 DUF2913 family protein [Yersinia enterocolitica]MBW5848744.1 DUF2913 family protein [Yersinia enterocolitica]MBW5857490.1 DUF2913 family protein [Yersinia enterocolitica]MBW5861791.1 DUF2913 family protein [Yersinia enterocolitica]MBW5866141.1 DUF2913 family protein [Yersinia enterocolitica]
MTLTEKSGHLAWCALVALALARQDGSVQSPVQENLFLTRWLATALKQRRFTRVVSPDIEWLLKQGRQLGVSAKLTSKLNYLWRSCTGELSRQNDLFRLTYALEMAKDMLWTYRLLSDREWSGRNAVSLNSGVNGIYLSRTNLDFAFDDNGRQINQLTTRLTGNVAGVMKLFNRCGWQAELEGDASLPHQFTLMARQGVPGKDD